MNPNRKIIPLSDIIISEEFQQHYPATSKITKCYDRLLKNGKFDREITLDENNVLTDGYVPYLICRMVGVETVEAVTT